MAENTNTAKATELILQAIKLVGVTLCYEICTKEMNRIILSRVLKVFS